MEIKEWRRLAIQSITVLLAVFVCCICFREKLGQPRETVVHAGTIEEDVPDRAADATPEPVEEPVQYVTKADVESRSSTYIRIPKAETATASAVYVKDDYMDSTVQVTFEGVPAGSVTEQSILRIKGYQVEKGKVKEKKKDPLLKELAILDEKNENAMKNIVRVRLKTKRVYAPKLYEAGDAWYISLLEPRKAFEQIVVVDAGHGGMDEGTHSGDGKYLEKECALSVTREIERILQEQDVKVYYTRTRDEEISKPERMKLVNDVQPDLFISIHCNASDVGDRTAHGAETLYSGGRTKEISAKNRRAAEIMLDSLCKETGQRNRGIIKRKDLYILNHSRVPATIVEIGYMSNLEDLKFMLREKGQEQIAEGICAGILRTLEEFS